MPNADNIQDYTIPLDPEQAYEFTEKNDLTIKSTLSFAKLIDFWRQTIIKHDDLHASVGRQLLEQVEKIPDLQKPIEDLDVLDQHRQVVDCLMSAIVPPAGWENTMVGAVVPFRFEIVYATPNFDKFLRGSNAHANFSVNMDMDELMFGKIINAYGAILQKFYNTTIEFDFPLIFTAPDPVTGLNRHLKIAIDTRFIDIVQVSEAPKLDEAQIQSLLSNMNNLDVWKRVLPLKHFEFRGFTIFTATDVTDQETLSSLKFSLIEKNSLMSGSGFDQLEDKIRTYLKRPELRLGITPFAADRRNMMTYARRIGRSLVFREECTLSCDDFIGSVYDRAYTSRCNVLESDLTALEQRTPVEDLMLENGIRNIVVAPLQYDDKIVGMIEIGSPNAGDFNTVNILKMKEVLPLFAIAVRRSMDELESQVQAIIKEECTAIHPSVEWRFRNAALDVLRREDESAATVDMDPIVFDDIYPLYGLSDIRNSSSQRNQCIQTDLLEQLTLARSVLSTARAVKAMPILDELMFRIDRYSAQIKQVLGSGDELSVLEFLRSNVEPLMRHLSDFAPAIAAEAEKYFNSLDAELAILYRKRRDFDESVARINDTIAKMLDSEQEKAQAMFPHYFEKYKTDGVDHGMYVGASLVEDGNFDRVYLKNLRLWQLETVAQIGRKTEALKKDLKIPLATTHLVLVQDTPLAIRFRQDEKQFDVDGAYNIRYEIMKKRIDKALIKGRQERLTQPGKIAIVYSQMKEASEYREYIEYLQYSGYLTNEVEDLELEDLQGITGLRALRVSVNFTKKTAVNGTASTSRRRKRTTMAFSRNGGVQQVPASAQ